MKTVNLKISGDGNLSCTSKWLALSNQPLQCAIGPSLVNDDNAERIRGLDHTEHTALIIPRACQNVEGRFIMEAKSTSFPNSHQPYHDQTDSLLLLGQN